MSAQRIVSLAPSITEILFALGLEQRIVGVTEICDYPPDARRKPKVGDYQISPEKVVALKPDLVVAHEVLNARVIPVLKRLGAARAACEPEPLRETVRLYSRDRRSDGHAARGEPTHALDAGAGGACASSGAQAPTAARCL
jgi:hypothetical protein